MPHGGVSSAFTGAVMADVRILTTLELEVINARRSFLAADEREDYITADYWFAELQRLADLLPQQRHHK